MLTIIQPHKEGKLSPQNFFEANMRTYHQTNISVFGGSTYIDMKCLKFDLLEAKTWDYAQKPYPTHLPLDYNLNPVHVVRELL